MADQQEKSALDRVLAKGLPPPSRQTQDAPPEGWAERLAAAPIIIVAGLVGTGCDGAGEHVQLAIDTATQGVVRLQFELKVLATLIDSALAMRGQAEARAQKAGRDVPHSLTIINKYAVGDIMGVPGVVLTLNYGLENQQMFVIAQSQFAAELGQGLIRQAGIARQSERLAGQNGSKLILPPGMQ